jgi:hypothetical protein
MSQRKRTNPILLAGYCSFIAVLFLLAALPTHGLGQQPLQGGVSSDSQTDYFYTVYANSNPLDGAPEQTPTTIGPGNSNRCIPPNPRWQLVAQQQDTCYWYAPYAKPLKGYVVAMAKMSWVESTGGTCSVNPFSNPDSPNATAICSQPAPANNPYAPTSVPTSDIPGQPTDYYSSNPHDPTRLLAAYNDLIDKLSHGTPRQNSVELGPQLQVDMNDCSKYAAQGVLPAACCSNLAQAANMTMIGNGPYHEVKVERAAAASLCIAQGAPPPAGPTQASGTDPEPPPTPLPRPHPSPHLGPSPTAISRPSGGDELITPYTPQQSRCGATVAAENARHKRVMAEITLELQNTVGLSTAAGEARLREQTRHDECLQTLSPQAPPTAKSVRKATGKEPTVRTEGNEVFYFFTDTLNGVWKAPATIGYLQIQPKTFRIDPVPHMEDVYRASVQYVNGRAHETGSAYLQGARTQ